MAEPYKKYWMVTRWRSQAAGSQKEVFFDSRDAANAEAVRLAQRNVEIRYVVLEAMGHVIFPLPAMPIKEL